MTLDDYPVELTAPDISPYRDGGTGVDYVTTLESGRAGPHVMVAALVHGNELCGAIALDFLFRQQLRPTRGRLTLAFCNVAAFATFDPRYPSASRFIDEDFNRLWDVPTLDGSRRTVELARAREIRPIVDTVDLLLDIHSMQHATAPLMLAGPLDKGLALAGAVGYPPTVVADRGHAAGRRMRDYAGFGEEASPRNALLVECGQHWETASAVVAIETTLRFLRHADIVDRAFLEAHLRGPAPAQRMIRVTQAVTVKTDRFAFVQAFRGLEVIEKAGTEIGRDGDEPILTPYDRCVLIMPSRRLTKGQTAVRLGRIID